jgi:hypothetical protein
MNRRNPEARDRRVVPSQFKTMELKEILAVLAAEEIVKGSRKDLEIRVACGSDLMSDVLAFVKTDSLLLTGLTNPQVVRTAEMAEIIAVCFVRGKRPPSETVALAREKGIPLLVTDCSMFEACGRLYQQGLIGWDKN